jgi:predicted nucleic acid-binding protein
MVIDASAMVDLLLGRLSPGVLVGPLFAPVHLDVEVVSALGRLHRAGELSDDDVDEMIDDLAVAPIQRIPLAALGHLVWDLRANVRLADAWYVVVARMLDGALLTTDSRLAEACRRHRWCPVTE